MAEVLDRVVASVGDTAITERDVRREYLFERFLDGDWPPPPPAPATLDQVRERLTYQKLLAVEETRLTQEGPQLQKAAEEQLRNIRKRFHGEEDYQAALQTLGMHEPQVLARIIAHEQILQMIDQRLRPMATPDDTEVEAYYHDTLAPEYKRRNSGAIPPLADVEGQVREILVQKRINELLAQWLEELKPLRHVMFHSF
jgi:hypothetical protein